MILRRTLHRILPQVCIPLIFYFFFRLSFPNTHFFFTGPVDSDNIFVWQAIIVGPPDTPYYEGMFPVSIHFTEEYPLAPMKVNLFKFLTS